MHFRLLQSFRALPLCALQKVAVAILVLSTAILGAPAQGRHIFPEPGVANEQIHQALQRAKAEHKRVILDFGGDWCGDCQVLDIYFHDPANKPILDANYVLVDVNVGHLDANQDIAAKYGVPLKRGVPALAVLDPNGKIVYAQANGEFEKMRTLQSSELTKFLNEWKPARGGARGR